MPQLTVLVLLFLSAIYGRGENAPLKLDPKKYVDFKSSEGMERLDRSGFKKDFFYLVNHFESQQLTPWGGVAAAVVVMNALRFQVPDGKTTMPVDNTLLTKAELSVLEKDYNPFFNKFTQNNIFIKGVKEKLDVLGRSRKTENGEVKDRGYQLRQLHEVFVAHQFASEIHIASPEWKSSEIRKVFKENLRNPNNFILANYRRLELGQPFKNGHMSPVAAYDEKSDSFLILDVNANISTWGWVKTEFLLQAMNTFDTVENRGYLIVGNK